jgi:cobalt-zinc-cadmium resistance protein CzcA
VEIDRAAIARHGIAAREVLEVVESLGTREVGSLQDGDRRFPITLRIDDRYRRDPAAIARIPVTAANGDRIPLATLTKIALVEGPTAINREWAKRRIVVQANVRDRDIGSYVSDVMKTIDREVSLPPGYYVRYGGQFEHLERAQHRLLVVVPIALGLILVLLYISLGSVRSTLLIFTGVPLALTGGVGALWLRGLPVSISAAIGFIALSGVAVLNGLVMVTFIESLRARGESVHDAVVAGSLSRLRPVMMTALVASLGFVPMALNTGMGAEVQKPLATVVIGGIISSTLLTLVVLPVLYTLFGARRRPEPVAEAPSLVAEPVLSGPSTAASSEVGA